MQKSYMRSSWYLAICWGSVVFHLSAVVLRVLSEGQVPSEFLLGSEIWQPPFGAAYGLSRHECRAAREVRVVLEELLSRDGASRDETGARIARLDLDVRARRSHAVRDDGLVAGQWGG